MRFEKSKALELVTWFGHRPDPQLPRRGPNGAVGSRCPRRVRSRTSSPMPGAAWPASCPRRPETEFPPHADQELVLHGGVLSDAEVIRATSPTTRPRLRRGDVVAAAGLLNWRQACRSAPPATLWPDTEESTSDYVLLATSLTAQMPGWRSGRRHRGGVLYGVGLNVIAGQETLIGLRMRADALPGTCQACVVEWESYQRTLTADPWSDGEAAPSWSPCADNCSPSDPSGAAAAPEHPSGAPRSVATVVGGSRSRMRLSNRPCSSNWAEKRSSIPSSRPSVASIRSSRCRPKSASETLSCAVSPRRPRSARRCGPAARRARRRSVPSRASCRCSSWASRAARRSNSSRGSPRSCSIRYCDGSTPGMGCRRRRLDTATVFNLFLARSHP